MTDYLAPRVFVVDDDTMFRNSLCQMLEGAGLEVENYPNGSTFLADYREDRPGCLLLDIAMPGMSGLEVQHEVKERGLEIPILFLTGHGDVPMAVRAVKSGAVDFLEKPVQGKMLLDRVRQALAIDKERRACRERVQTERQHFTRLTTREREIMQLLAEGHPNKRIALKLDISVRTVEVHRAHIMKKLHVKSLPELVRFVAFIAN